MAKKAQECQTPSGTRLPHLEDGSELMGKPLKAVTF